MHVRKGGLKGYISRCDSDVFIYVYVYVRVQSSLCVCNCVNNVITPIPLPLFSPVRSTVPLSRNRGSATRIGGKHKNKVLYRGIGGV